MLACAAETASGDLDWIEGDHVELEGEFSSISVGEIFFLHVRRTSGFPQDAMGSVIGMASASGASTATIKYDAFGNVTSSSGSAAAIPSGVGTDFRYHGMQLDAASGLYHVRARTYDARAGRFTSRDPVSGVLSRPETMNPYVLDHNNPHVWRDPSGRFSMVETMAVSAIIGITASLAIPALNNHLNSTRAYKYGWEARLAATTTNYATGFSDTISFGLGKVLRDLVGIGGVDVNSPEYYGGMATGLVAQFWAGFFTAGASTASAAVVFEETAPQAVDHVVLGLQSYGLEQTAAQVGGRTLMNSPTWQMDVMEAIANPAVRISVSLRGMSGATTYEKIMSAATRGASGVLGGATNWEISMLWQAGRLRTVQFLDDAGRIVENPFL